MFSDDCNGKSILHESVIKSAPHSVQFQYKEKLQFGITFKLNCLTISTKKNPIQLHFCKTFDVHTYVPTF